METARGCPFKCNFCSVWKFHERTFREKSPARVVARAAGDQGAEAIFITDDIFWMNVKRGEEMARQIKAAGHQEVLHRADAHRHHLQVPAPDRDVEGLRQAGHLPRPGVGHRRGAEGGQQEEHRRQQRPRHQDPAGPRRRLHAELHRRSGLGRATISNACAIGSTTTGAYNSGFSVLTPLPGTDLWDTAKDSVTTHDWEMYDIVHAVLPTTLPLDEFYEEYSALWRHVLDVRYRYRGKLRTYMQLGAALATGKVSLNNVRRGMNMAKMFSKPETFLRAHE